MSMSVSMSDSSCSCALQNAIKRCNFLIDTLQTLQISLTCKRTLLRLARAELSFLSRRSSSSSSLLSPLSVNIGHLEAVVHILQQPFVTGVSGVCKLIPYEKKDMHIKGIHVDIVCCIRGKPVWIIVSDRNPKYISWDGTHRNKGLQWRIESVLNAAGFSQILRPSSVILFFSHGIRDQVLEKIMNEFGASNFALDLPMFHVGFSDELEDDWVNIFTRSYQGSAALAIKVDACEKATSASEHKAVNIPVDAAPPEYLEENATVNPHNDFISVISHLKPGYELRDGKSSQLDYDERGGGVLINFDTTALIALVSEISNGGAEKILSTLESELQQRFKGNTDFVITQAMSELQHPILADLSSIISSKRGIICQTVLSEFQQLIMMCGGPKEKLRAEKLLKCLFMVPDNPSDRFIGLPTTRKLAQKNKVVFGTGDHWHAPTLTANMGFVRAVSQTGMSLYTIEHRPRALAGK